MVRKSFSFVMAGLLACFFSSSGRAQQPVRGERGVAAVRAVVNFAELARREALASPEPPERKVAPFMPMPAGPPVPPGIPAPRAPEGPAAEPVSETALAPSPAPAAGFEALGDDGTALPPDTMGAVGLNHLMVTLNSQVRIQTRSGVAISTVSLDSFWSATGATVVFDPRLTYDLFNDRWIFVAVSDLRSADSSLLVGVSQTADPTGNWNLFLVDVDANNVDWGDFPAVGFNKDWIVVTLNMFPIAGGQFSNSQLYAFNKANLYAGSATFTRFTDAVGGYIPAVTYDNSQATLYLVRHVNGNFEGSGFLRVSTIAGSVGSEVFTPETALVSTPNPWAFVPPGFADFAPQKDTTQKIQTNDSRILNAVFRNGSLWAAQWWQFDPTAIISGTITPQQFGRVDDSTGTFFYAFPSIAVNSRNDVLLGYSSFSASQFASANYSFRAASDPANTMRSDVLLKPGEATYFKTDGTHNRWGDYSSTVVDPVNDLELWTIQEYASSPPFPNGDDRWGTWWGKISPPREKRRGQLISE